MKAGRGGCNGGGGGDNRKFVGVKQWRRVRDVGVFYSTDVTGKVLVLATVLASEPIRTRRSSRRQMRIPQFPLISGAVAAPPCVP